MFFVFYLKNKKIIKIFFMSFLFFLYFSLNLFAMWTCDSGNTYNSCVYRESGYDYNNDCIADGDTPSGCGDYQTYTGGCNDIVDDFNQDCQEEFGDCLHCGVASSNCFNNDGYPVLTCSCRKYVANGLFVPSGYYCKKDGSVSGCDYDAVESNCHSVSYICEDNHTYNYCEYRDGGYDYNNDCIADSDKSYQCGQDVTEKFYISRTYCALTNLQEERNECARISTNCNYCGVSTFKCLADYPYYLYCTCPKVSFGTEVKAGYYCSNEPVSECNYEFFFDSCSACDKTITVTPNEELTFIFSSCLDSSKLIKTINICNPQNACNDLLINSISSDNANFKLTSNYNGITIPKGECKEIQIEYDWNYIKTTDTANLTIDYTQTDNSTKKISLYLSAPTCQTLGITPNNYDYGDVKLGEVKNTNIIFTNEIYPTIEVSNIISNDTECNNVFLFDSKNFVLNSTQSKSITVSFKPQAAKTYNCNFVVYYNYNGQNYTNNITLIGNGTIKYLETDNNELDFGNLLIDNTTNKSITLFNPNSSIDFYINDITSTSECNNVFLFDNKNFVLDRNSNKTITITFKPLENKIYNCNFTISYSALGQNYAKNITLTGGGYKDISIFPESLNFESSSEFISVNDNKTLNISFTNDNDNPDSTFSFVVNSIISSDSECNEVFTFSKTNFTIDSGETTNVGLTFSPKDKKVYNCSFVVTYNIAGVTKQKIINVQGEGKLAELAIAPYPMSFGGVLVNTVKDSILYFRNNNKVDLRINSITGTSSCFNTFSFSSKSFLITPDQIYQNVITFTPKDGIAYNCSFNIDYTIMDKYNYSTTIIIAGKGVFEEMQASPEQLDFGQIYPNTSLTKTITLINPDNIDLIVHSVDIDSSCNMFSASNNSFVISPNSSYSLNFTFTPQDLGLKNCSAIINYTLNGHSFSKTITLTGGTKTNELVVSPTELDFGQMYVTTSLTKTISLTNNNSVDIQVTNIAFDCPNDYFTVPETNFKINANSSTDIQVTFSPNDVTPYNCQATITYNILNATFNKQFTVKGQGKPPILELPDNVSFIIDECDSDQMVKTVTVCNKSPISFQAKILLPEGLTTNDSPVSFSANSCSSFNIAWDKQTVIINDNITLQHYVNDYIPVTAGMNIKYPLNINVLQGDFDSSTRIGNLDFGQIVVNNSKTSEIEFDNLNPCLQNRVYDFEITSDDSDSIDECKNVFQIQGVDPTTNSFTLYGKDINNSTKLINIIFSPKEAKEYSCLLKGKTTALDMPDFTITLHGSGVNYQLPSFNLSFVHPDDIVFDCSFPDKHCEATVKFIMAPDIKSREDGDINCSTQAADVLKAVKDYVTFNYTPCVFDDNSFLITLPQDYDYAVRLDLPTTVCPFSQTPACNITSQLLYNDYTIDNVTCAVTGYVKFTITGDENVERCRNLPVKAEDNTVKYSNIATKISFNVIPYVKDSNYDEYTPTVYYVNNALTLEVPIELHDNVTESITAIKSFYLNITPIMSGKKDNDGQVALYSRIEANFYSNAQSPTTLPPNFHIESIKWLINDNTVAQGTDFDKMKYYDLLLPNSDEKKVKMQVLVNIDMGDGQYTKILYTSNTLRYFTPVDCPDGQVPYCVYKPPYIRPQGAPNRPIFETSAVKIGNTPVIDYNSYTGIAAPGALPPSEQYIQTGYWIGGASKEGEWSNYNPDTQLGVAGYIDFTWKNSIPWDVYFMCPLSYVELPEITKTPPEAILPQQVKQIFYGNACKPPEDFSCDKYRTDADLESWTLIWSMDGWLCSKFECKETIHKIDSIPGLKCSTLE